MRGGLQSNNALKIKGKYSFSRGTPGERTGHFNSWGGQSIQSSGKGGAREAKSAF